MNALFARSLVLVATATLAVAAASAQPEAKRSNTWRGCCGLTPWPAAAAMNDTPRNTTGIMGGFGYILGGSPLRHHLGLTGQIPAAYAQLKNPLPPTSQNSQIGAAVYDADCASCHGATRTGRRRSITQARPTASPARVAHEDSAQQARRLHVLEHRRRRREIWNQNAKL